MIKLNAFPLLPMIASFSLEKLATKLALSTDEITRKKDFFPLEIGGILLNDINKNNYLFQYQALVESKKLDDFKTSLSTSSSKSKALTKNISIVVWESKLDPLQASNQVMKNKALLHFSYSEKSFPYLLCTRCSDKDSHEELDQKWIDMLFQHACIDLNARQSSWFLNHLARLVWQDNLGFKTNALRVYHKEEEALSIDCLNQVLWFSCFHNEDIIDDIKDYFEKTKEVWKIKSYLYRKMLNRGKDPEEKVRNQSEKLPSSWTISENGYQILLKSDQGQSSGLFLDQRANRRFVKQTAKNKKVLNLFSYTSGFSLAAAMGGASEVISVDTSKASLEWSKENFSLNNLEPTKYYFYAMEAERFLDIAIKKSKVFDIIICDPPSFARNKKKLFRIQEDLNNLLLKIKSCMASGSELLLSVNYEQWTQSEFSKELSKVFTKKEALLELVLDDGDHERWGEKKILKAIKIKKR